MAEKKFTFKQLKSLMTAEIKVNSNKAVFSVLLYTLINTIFSGLAWIPAFFSFTRTGSISVNSLVTSIVLFIIISVFLKQIAYGLNVIIARLVQNEFVTLGFLFIAFKKDQKRTFLMSFIYTVIQLLVILITFIICYFIFTKNPAYMALFESYAENPSDEILLSIFKPIMTLSIFAIVLSCLLLFPFIFRNVILYSDRNTKALKAIGKSFIFTVKNIFRFIGFFVYSSYLPILILLFANFASSFLGESAVFGEMILSVISFIAQINVIVRYNFAIVLFYYAQTDPWQIYILNEGAIEEDSKNQGFNKEDAEDAEVLSISDAKSEEDEDGERSDTE